MTPVLIDEAMRAKLARATGPVEVIAPDGTRIGFFTPAPPGPPVKYNIDPGISQEELARRRADTTSPRHTTEQVIAKLRSL